MANLPKKKVFDTEGNEVLPITHISAVYDDNGTSVETLLINMDEKIDNKIIEGYYSNGSFYTAPPITHDYVEIGGIKWATMNLGASSVTDYGLYFQWGDSQGYTSSLIGSGEDLKYFSWADYKYGNGEMIPGNQEMSKYNAVDQKTTLDPSDDGATVAWGGAWRMPTYAEIEALGEAVNTTWTSDYNDSGVAGRIMTDKTDNSKSLFFPAAGYYYKGSGYAIGEEGRYLTNTNSGGTTSSRASYSIKFSNSYIYYNYLVGRSDGLTIRAVYDGDAPTAITAVAGALYVDKATNTQYRWDGTAYVQLTKLTYTVAEEDIEDADETIISQALRKTSQSLTSSEKAQVLTNLGISDLISGSLQKTAQVLSSAEKTLVLTNLGISSAKNITISTSEPTSSDGNNGDIWLVYEAQ